MEEYEYTEHWMQRIVDRLDRLIEIGESLEGQLRLPSEEEPQTFADAEEPAKEPEPEHPAGPMPDPGEGYRILGKNPPEDLSPGDEYFVRWDGLWHESSDASKGIREQRERRWYRRKIEQPKDQYRQPVLPADAGEQCEFSDDGQRWLSGRVYGWVPGRNWVTLHNSSWKHARIKKES